MEQWKKILLVGVTLFILAFLGLHMFVNIRGKELLSQKLVGIFNRKVKIGGLSTFFPANIYIRDIEVQGLFKIDEIVAGRGLFDIFAKDFNLSSLKVVKPALTLEKGFVKPAAEALTDAGINLEKTDSDKLSKAETKAVPPDLKSLAVPQNIFLFSGFSIGRLIISEGTFNFIDRSVGDKEITVKVEHFNLKADNLNFSGRGVQITSFDLKGTIPWREGIEKGRIEAEGWINFFKKDIQATIKIEDIDGVYLYPYYSAWVDLEKVRIEKANLNFVSNIHGLNNNVTAECHLELTDIVRKERPAEEPAEKEEKIASAVLDIFKTLDQGKIVLDFTIRTKMDRPEFGFGNIKMAVEDKLAQAKSSVSVGPQDILIFPVKLVEGMVKSATDLSRAMVDGTFAVGNELKKSLEQSFKKEPK